MFLEPRAKTGWIEVICGSMFSGKTEELIRRIKRAQIAHQSLRIFKPAIDIRYDAQNIVSHDANSIQSIPLKDAAEILPLSEGVDVVGIDEAQFFGLELLDICEVLAVRGTRVIVAGLDMDYLGKPFGPIPHLLATAEYLTKLHAICVRCGHLATHSYRLKSHEGQIVLGEKDLYEARCRICYHAGDSAGKGKI